MKHPTLDTKGKEDILRFISENEIRIINLCHIPEDGRLKTLSFTVDGSDKAEEILELGERVDGSSLFSFLEPGKSDIYILPRRERAFVNPFSEIPTLTFICDYFDAEGEPLEAAPQNALARAENGLFRSSGIVLKALAELEFYVISKQKNDPLFPAASDKNYHESAPFAKFEGLRNEVLLSLASLGIDSKYGHGEVGRVQKKDGEFMEQQEVELSTQTLREMAESVVIAKWAIRNICAKHGFSVSFAPKVDAKHAGSGMHIHVSVFKDGNNITGELNGKLSVQAQKIVGGILRFASSLSAFANPTPISYLRFVAQKESPMHICWSVRNRLALVRIPLWRNPKKANRFADAQAQTFEYRAPDASANPYLLLAGITLAAHYGLNNPEEALRIAKDLHLNSGRRTQRLKTLPLSCSESARSLESDRHLYEAGGVFPGQLIDKTITSLKSYRDTRLWQRISNKPDKVEEILKEYRHCG